MNAYIRLALLRLRERERRQERRRSGAVAEKELYTETRSEAWVLPSGDAVVLVNGKSGGVAISHVEVL